MILLTLALTSVESFDTTLIEASFVWRDFRLVGDGARFVGSDKPKLSDVPVRLGGGIKPICDCLASLAICIEGAALCTAACLLESWTLLVETIRVSARCVIEGWYGPFSVMRRGGRPGRLSKMPFGSFISRGSLAAGLGFDAAGAIWGICRALTV